MNAPHLESECPRTVSEFSLATTDGQSHVQGDVWFPSQKLPAGAVLIVPGGGTTSRDGDMGDTGTHADLMYRRLAVRLCGAGYLVVRYDNRGIAHCSDPNFACTPDDRQDVDPVSFFISRIASNLRATITPESQVADLILVYNHLINVYSLEQNRIAVFAHSEGALHVARAVHQSRIRPRGILFASASAMSPAATMKWQSVDRYVDEVMRWDTDGDGVVTRDDVSSGWAATWLSDAGLAREDVEPPRDGWYRALLERRFEVRYREERDVVLAQPDDTPFSAPGGIELPFVLGSYRWYKQWFTDTVDMLTLLNGYDGEAAFHFGAIDRQLSASRQAAYVQSRTKQLRRAPICTVHEERGHAFGSKKPLTGPMDQAAEDLFAAELIEFLSGNSRQP